MYIIRLPPERADDLHRALYAELLRWWRSVPTPIAWVLDYRAVEHVEHWEARTADYAQFARDAAPLAEGKTICHAVIARDELKLAAFRTMFWRDVLKFPRRFFCDFDEAQQWVAWQMTTVRPTLEEHTG